MKELLEIVAKRLAIGTFSQNIESAVYTCAGAFLVSTFTDTSYYYALGISAIGIGAFAIRDAGRYLATAMRIGKEDIFALERGEMQAEIAQIDKIAANFKAKSEQLAEQNTKLAEQVESLAEQNFSLAEQIETSEKQIEFFKEQNLRLQKENTQLAEQRHEHTELIAELQKAKETHDRVHEVFAQFGFDDAYIRRFIFTDHADGLKFNTLHRVAQNAATKQKNASK